MQKQQWKQAFECTVLQHKATRFGFSKQFWKLVTFSIFLINSKLKKISPNSVLEIPWAEVFKKRKILKIEQVFVILVHSEVGLSYSDIISEMLKYD